MFRACVDDRRWPGTEEHVVEPDDLGPIRVGRDARLGVHSGDGGLQCIGSEAARLQRLLDKRAALGNLLLVPERTILIVEQHELAGL